MDFSKSSSQSHELQLQWGWSSQAMWPWCNHCFTCLRGYGSGSRPKCHGRPPFLPGLSRFAWINASQSVVCLWSISSPEMLFLTMVSILSLSFWERFSRAPYSAIPKLPSSPFEGDSLEDPIILCLQEGPSTLFVTQGSHGSGWKETTQGQKYRGEDH